MRIEAYLEKGALEHGDSPAVLAARRHHSYAELDLKSARLAAALQDRGVRRGERVALFMDNRWEAVLTIFAVLKAGGAVNPIDPSSTAEELAGALASSRPVAIVTEARLASTAASVVAEAESVRVVVLAGGDRVPATDTCISLEEVVNRIGRPRDLAPVGDDTDAAVVLAGEAPLTHRCIAAAIGESEPSAEPMALPSLALPSGLSGLLAAVRAGAMLVMNQPIAQVAELQRRIADAQPAEYPVGMALAADSGFLRI